MLTGPEYQELLELRRLVQEQEQKIEHQSHQLRQQQIQIENLTQALLHARKKLFGPSTEVTQTEGQMSLFEQEELLHSLRQGQEEIVITEHKRKARQPGVRAEMIAALPVEVERCIVDPKEQCPVCKSPLIKVGEKSVRTEVIFQPAQLKVRQYIQEVYKCSQCGKEGSEHPADVFVGGKVPVSLLPHSLASASLVAGILYKKYDMGIPLARQERDWYRLGLCLYRSTMANWVIRCSEEYLLPIYERIHQELLGCGILHGDETRIQCNREPGKKASSESFMWVIRSGREEAVQAVFFHYARSRARKEAEKLYRGFQGYLVTDAYTGYDSLDGICRALCWSHVRRYYIDSIPLDSRGKEISGSKGAEGREWCDRLFQIEKNLKALPSEKRLQKRQELSRPVLEGFWAWVEEASAKYTANESLKTALTYTTNQRKYLETFLEDGRIPISNNDCETSIRPFATGRKAWLFADSPAGARASGIVYTLVETAKLNHLDVFGYLCYLLESLPELDHRNHPELLEAYLPWSETLPESCRLREHRINKKCMF